MQIIYDTGIIGKEHAEHRYADIALAIRKSKLNFKIKLVPNNKKTYDIIISTDVDIFDSWEDMSDYIRKLVVKNNKFWHKSENIKLWEFIHE